MTSNASQDSNASNAGKKKVTLRISDEDARRLNALRARRKLRIAQADGLGPEDRMSLSALALHYMRLGMAQAEKAAPVAPAQAPPPDLDKR